MALRFPVRPFFVRPFFDEFADIERHFLKPYWNDQTMLDGHRIGDAIENVKSETGDGQISVNVAQFKPEEIKVNINENQLIIEGKHEEKTDEHGLIQRHFIRKYTLPQGIRAENVKSELNSDGVLSIKYEKVPEEQKQTSIPITFVPNK
ncbi:unnamed protein product [Caenorhabditis angaria]|uniref:SHSP domain-containing protein n=1 Tax=Caenorhabditis angaria TaxID=860376 RepID=A0A9P1IXZ0_9PELO|nr:unnamed protein product [Caenorhabditis angaria]CAI5452265.1 unnamed protein product [Caenorhabditis angaria]